MLTKNNWWLLHNSLYVTSVEIGWEFDGTETDLMTPLALELGVNLEADIDARSIKAIRKVVRLWKIDTVNNHM